MLSENDKETILKYVKEYEFKEVFLFGSSLTSDNHKDIDIAVSGVKDKHFYKFCGLLIHNLSKTC